MSTDTNTVGRAQHSKPTFTLYGRIAEAYAEYIWRPCARTGWRLASHIVVWAIASPLVEMLAGFIGSKAFPAVGAFAPTLTLVLEGAILLASAVWIYWRHVPAAPTASRRIAYAIAFVGVLLAAGYAALWAAWMLATLLFGA
ncbi:hypothetical protein [uncultured Variovorax sp.]|uniref:hypothetical protein n=1 Tax=uncultured Variovorax sp. TaxID=114708 RepID=UPI0025E3A401|nr:hypothetical protein [uncultured Variovorax sp.]